MDRVRLGLTLLRVSVALLMLIHGAARAWLGIVDDFGVVLGLWGFPAGHGMEYSVLLIACVVVIALTADAAYRLGGTRMTSQAVRS